MDRKPTGPDDKIGGWGRPANDEDTCPKCGSKNFVYEPGFGVYAENVCNDCGFVEGFAS